MSGWVTSREDAHGPVCVRGDARDACGPTRPVPPPDGGNELARLGPYRLLQRLGEGGMGVVHLGLDPSGRAVAIKVLRDHVAHDAQARTRLAREVSSLSRVHHNGVAPVLDADVDGIRPYLVTKYVPGPPLDDWVRRRAPLAGAELVAFARGLSGALAAIHSAGVVHRDVKPGNVLMLDGTPVLIDFGIAHLVDEARLTVSGLVMGTPGYLPPEVLEGQPVSEATDWWGWAATLAYAATGRSPFGGGGMDAVMQRTLAGDCDLRGVDPRLAPLLRAALDPDPRRRPDRPVVMAALAAYAAGQDTTHSLTVAPRPQTSPASRAATVATTASISTSTSATATSAQRLPPTAALPSSAVPAPPTPRAPYAAFDARVRPIPEAAAGSVISTPPPGFSAPLSPGGWTRPAAGGSWRPVPPEQPAVPPHGDAPGPGGVVRAGLGTREPSGPVLPEPPAPAADPRLGRRARTGTLAALALALAALATVLPIAAALGALAWSALARTADRSVTALTLRRIERGARGRDVPLAVLASPVHLVTGVGAAALAALVPALLGIAGVFGTAVISASASGLTPEPTDPLPLACGMVVALLTAWWGIGGTSLRRGSRSLARGLAPGSVGAGVVTVLLLAAAAYLAIRSQATGAMVDWWPLRNAPFEGLAPPF